MNTGLHMMCRIDSAGISLTVFSGEHTIYRDYQPFPHTVHDERHIYDRMTHHADILLHRMCTDAREYVGKHPTTCVVVVGEPWSHMICRKINHARKTPFKLTQAMVQDLVARDMKRAEIQYREHRHSAHTEFSEPRYHNLSIAGHTIAQPWNKMINDVEITYTTGWFDVQIVEILKSVIHEQLRVPLLGITFHHEQSCIAAWWGKHGIENALLINPTGQVSELYIFQNGILAQWGTIPIGLPDFERALMHELGIGSAQLPGLMRLSQDGLLDGKVIQRMEKSLGKAFSLWKNDLNKFCITAVERGMIVEQIVWMGNPLHPAIAYAMRSVATDDLSFPVVFGAPHTGSIMLQAMVPNIRPEPGMVQDYIVREGISE